MTFLPSRVRPFAAAALATSLAISGSFGQNLVAVDGTVMGGVRSGTWRGLSDLGGWSATAKGSWTLHAPGHKPQRAKPNSVEQDEEHCGEGGSVVFRSNPFPEDARPVVAVQGEWNPFPRSPKPQGTTNKTYQQVVRDVLAKNGLRDVPIAIGRMDRIDLDGDGTEEVVLHAQAEGTQTQDGKLSFFYSILVVRRLERGTVVDHILPQGGTAGTALGRDLDWSNRMDLTLDGYADLDGDGILEILVSEHAVDYGGNTAWKLGAKGLSILAHESCGA
ncbi:MAG TPA: hypothetical protein PKO15_03495 [Fibrobacteria bacterium]|nr:hypothetical protein [Fibrobacteria bacterium]HOX51431.1 hypothetical protein [Fibrobacteria bacterium]